MFHYQKTSILPVLLLPCFDQNGNLTDHKALESKQILLLKNLFCGVVIPEIQRIQTHSNGLDLLTSLVWRTNNPLNVNYVKIHGDLHVETNADVTLPNLVEIKGSVYIGGNNTVNLPNLKKVGCNFEIAHTWQLFAPKLKEVKGDMKVKEYLLPALEVVGGSLLINETVHGTAHRLRSVGNNLVAELYGTFHAPQLCGIGGTLDVNGDLDELHLPKLLSKQPNHIILHNVRRVFFAKSTIVDEINPFGCDSVQFEHTGCECNHICKYFNSS